MGRIGLNILSLLLAASFGSQQHNIASAPDTAGIQKQMRQYLRDITELTFTVKSEVTVSDGNGTTKTRHSAHQLTYDAGAPQSKKNAYVAKLGTSRAGDWETHADNGLFLIAYVFLPDVGGEAYYHSTPVSAGEVITEIYGSREKCSPWKKSWFGWHGFKFREWCGTGELRVSKGDLLPVRASFSAAQVAPDLHSSDVPSYFYAVTFQQLKMSRDINPLLVPHDVTLTVKYKKHKVVVHNTYSVNPG